MIFSIPNLLASIAAQLDGQFPNIPVYLDSNQQGTSVPCFFVFLMNPTIDDEIDTRRRRNIGIDIVYVQERNEPDIDSNNAAMLETLDGLFDTVQYFEPVDEGESADPVPLHCLENSAHITDDDLHYQFRVKVRVSREYTPNPMNEMDAANVGLKGD